MSAHRGRNDRGTVLIITVVTMTLLAFGVLMLAGTVKRLLDASRAEALAAEQRLASKTATGVLDAWMADQGDSHEIFNNGAGRVWMSPLGEQPCPDPTTGHNICWRVGDVTDVTFDDPVLRGGEARREAKDVTIEVAAGCYTDNPEDCQHTRTTTRRYERSVLFQYQLHYDSNLAPEGALDAAIERLEAAKAALLAIDPNADVDTDPSLDDEREPVALLDPDNDGYVDTTVVFISEDTLNGPIRTTLTQVLYCGSPTFYRVEVSGDEPAIPSDTLVEVPGCPRNPLWLDKNGRIISPPPTPSDLINDGALIYGGDLALPAVDTSSYSADLLCDVVDFDFRFPLLNCQEVISDGYLIGPDSGSDITIHELVLDGSATVYASGDIIICGDIEARGTNSAGGPNVIALITEGDVIIDPNGQTVAGCGIAPGALLSGRPAFWATTPTPDCTDDGVDNHDLLLCNVAILAPEGAVYARNWHLPPSPTGGPTLTIEGSIAAKHLGLYGTSDPATGTALTGWAKNFTYPTDDLNTDDVCEGFWCARPPWWPGYDGNEWEPVGEAG